jgi:hypothetical protein
MYVKSSSSASLFTTGFLTILFLTLTQLGFAQQSALKIKLNGNGYNDETVLRYMAQATNGFDPAYDAWKLFSSNPDVPSIYTLDSTSSYAINSKPLLTASRNESLALIIPDSGTYTLDFTELFAFDSTTLLVMEDLATNHFQNIRLNSNYSFLVQGSSFPIALNHRFKLHFILAPVIHTTHPKCEGDKGALTLTHSGSQHVNYSLDRPGHSVSGILASSTDIPDLAPGNYTLRFDYFPGITKQTDISIEEGVAILADFELLFDGDKTLPGKPIQFRNLTPNAFQSEWSFGDGMTSDEMHTQHTYTSPGQFHVVLQTSNGDCEATYEKTIEIEAPTGINEYGSNETSISYFQGNIQINSVGTGKHIYKVILFSLSGKTLMESEPGQNQGSLSLPAPELHQQVFICTVFWNDNTVESKKIYIH